MSIDLIRAQTPEEKELARKLAELTILESELAQRELDLATLQAELHAFERRYLRIVGIEALALAKSLPLLPHFPIGTWGEQAGTWSQAAGTWADAKRDEEIQNDLKKRAKSGADIRDRGAYIEALQAHADGFVTSDNDLVGKGPSGRIAEKYELRIMTPVELASELSCRSKQ